MNDTDRLEKVIASVPELTIVDRLESLFTIMVKDSGFIPAMLRPTLNQLVNGYLQKATPAELKKIVTQIRDEVIPYLLEDEDN